MAAKPMPGKLMIVLGLMTLGVILYLVTAAILSAIIGVALIVGVIAGNDGVRTFLRALAIFQMLWAAIVVFALSSAVSTEAALIAAVFGVGSPAFFFWTLGQDDVREWMFRKNFHIEDEQPPPGTVSL